MASEHYSLAAEPVGLPDPFDESSRVDELLNRARVLAGYAPRPASNHALNALIDRSANLSSLAGSLRVTLSKWAEATDGVARAYYGQTSATPRTE